MTHPNAEGPFTEHFLERASHRGLRPDTFHFILEFARAIHATGAVHYTLLERDVPDSLLSHPEVRRARDWIVVCGHDGSFLTCYRRSHASRFLRHKTRKASLLAA